MIYIIRAPEVMTLQAHLSLCVPGERTFYGVKVPKQPGSGKTYAWKKKKLKETVTGWVNYFKQADMKSYLTRIDEWLRTRLAVFVCHVFPKSNKSTCLNPQKIYKRIYSVEPKYLAVNDRLSRHVPWQNQRTLLR